MLKEQLYYLFTYKPGNISCSLFKKLLESSSDGHITWRAELCQKCPREGLVNSTGLKMGQMAALKGRPKKKMQSTKKRVIEQELMTVINILVKWQ